MDSSTTLRKRKNVPKSSIQESLEIIEPSNNNKIKRRSTIIVILEKISDYAGVVAGIITFTVIIYFAFTVSHILTPSCPAPYGRLCNNRGTCIDSICYCDALYSGNSCTDTQVPGYDVKTNTECSGYGNAYPFIFVPDECFQSIENGERIGPGWQSNECIKYVFSVQQEILKANGDLSKVKRSITIPNCLCYVGRGGQLCQRSNCPVDENGNICGGHGDTSVGLIKNGTTTGNGCQCFNYFSFNQEPYISYFDEEGFLELFTRYNYMFTRTYCGQVYQFVNSSGDTIPNFILAYTTMNDYKCFCSDDWSGIDCTEGRCPMNTATNAICYGNGHPGYGFGKLTNTTLEFNNGKRCSLICETGYSFCNNKCFLDDDTLNGFAQINQASYCTARIRCPQDRPIRCSDNSCVAFPDDVINTCALGFNYGTIDYSQIDYAVALYKCPNITSQEYFEACFFNTSIVQGITQNYTDQGGFHILPGYNITVELGSPLIYFEIVSNQSGLTVQTWDGQMITFNDDGFVSNIFSYTTNGQWERSSLEPNGGILTLVNVNTSEYTFGPMGWNYSSSLLYNSSYTTTRASSSLIDIVVVLNAQSSHIVNSTYSFTKSSINGVLISFNTTNTGVDQPIWYYPDGTLADNELCLSQPSNCAWYITSDETQLRNLQSTYYICNDTLHSIIMQQEPCEWEFSSYVSRIINTFYSWETYLDVTIEVPLTIEILEFNIYELSIIRTSWPFTISWIANGENNLDFIIQKPILVENLVFLTLDKLTVPCVCEQISVIANRSALNDVWWLQTTLRTPNLQLLQTGDYVLAADFSLGSRILKRSIVTSIDESSETLTVQALNTDFFFDVALKNARLINNFEIVAGLPDADLMITPFHCPSGDYSSASSIIVEDPVSCNCTYAFPISDCNCTDVSTHDKWGCQCNGTGDQCMCGFPANHEFERDLMDTLNDLTEIGCSCLLFQANETERTNTSVLIEDINNSNVTFNFSVEQIPTHIVVKTIGDNCGYATFEVYASSYLFTDIQIDVEYNFTTDPDPCEYWLTLYMNQEYAFSSLTLVSYNDTIITWSTLLFSVEGFSLLQQDPAPLITASSNSENAININLLNSTYWMPSTDIRHYPTWIRIDLSRNHYIDFTKVIFYYGGRDSGNFSIPIHVYLQGSQNFGISWHTLISWGVYVIEGGWFESTFIFNSSIAYSSYRIIGLDGIFGIRQWNLYSKQQCNCTDETTYLVLNVNSTEGLLSISEELNEVQFLYDNLNSSIPCIAENNCTIQNQDATNNGICNDVLYQGTVLKIPKEFSIISNTTENITSTIIINSEIVNVNYTFYEYVTNPGGIGFNAVQFAQEESDFYNDEELAVYFRDHYIDFNTFIANDTTGLWIFYFSDLYTVLLNDSVTRISWIPDTFTYWIVQYDYSWGNLVSSGRACIQGTDLSDCGPSNRLLARMEGFSCIPTPRQSELLNYISNGTLLASKGYYITNLTDITSYWSAFYQNITLTRKVTQIQLNNCPGQTCPFGLNYKCANGKCVTNKDECDLRYNCPGNGCVHLTDTNSYRCACESGHGGDSCQFSSCLPATPELKFSDGLGTPPSEQCFCGGPPPFRIKPPININVDHVLTKNEIELINMRPTTNSAPASIFDIDYHAIMPLHAPFGKVILREVFINGQRIETTCPCIRRGYFDEYIFLSEDVQSRSVIQRRPIWKTYTNPFTNERETFPWFGICTYDDFPYRCSNSHCVANKGHCELSLQMFPLCNNRGECRADGFCACYSNYRTFMINNVYSQTIQYPYASENGITLPTVWKLNYNWKHHSLSQCAATNTDLDNSQQPTGCFTGTRILNFVDKHVLCPITTPFPNLCAPSINECNTGQNLTERLICSGNGIIRQKDYTGEFYCACGSPISPLLNITGVSTIVQLKPNGYGGSDCSQYFADTSKPLLWSSWDFKSNQPWFSTQTGQQLPGKWIKGNLIVGPRPEDRILWEGCCSGYSRLELCPFVPCNMPPNIRCVTPMECLTYKESAPLIYICNGHGIGLGDGRCECDKGYTYELSQFSDHGCYRFVKCPISSITNTECGVLPQCSQPKEWRYPLSFDKYLEQQWLICGLNGKGLYSNATKLSKMSSTVTIFQEQYTQALQEIALSVIAAETSLNGCICVYPDDTQFDKCCMVENGIDYRYRQNFNYPYFLNITIDDYSLLTDGILQAGLYSGTYITFEEGDIFTVNLPSINSTTISAIRIYGYSPSPGVQISYWNSDFSSQVCIVSSLISEEDEQKTWLTSTPGIIGAHYCGPFYTCVNSNSFPLYEENCGIDINSISCITYIRSSCEEDSSNIYWPIDSLNRYDGCLRSNDANGCVCCRLDTSNSPVTDGIIKVRIDAGTIDIGQFRIYGYTENALIIPNGLIDYLNSKGPPNSGCQDSKYLIQYLGADGSIYTPPQNEVVFLQDAKNICSYTGGFLAISQNIFNPSDVSLLIKQCSFIIKSQNGECWVNAINVNLNDTIIPRSEIFESSLCTTYGCYESFSNQSYAHFFSNSSTLYTSARITGQISLITLANNLETIYNRYGLPLVAWDITPSIDKVNTVYVLIESGQCQYQFILTADPYFAAANPNAYLYGEFIPWKSKAEENCDGRIGGSFSVAIRFEKNKPINYATLKMFNGNKSNCRRKSSGSYSSLFGINTFIDTDENIPGPILGDMFALNCQTTKCAVSGGHSSDRILPFGSGSFSSYNCISFFPSQSVYIKYAKLTYFIPKANTGTLYKDLIYGYTNQPYMPLFTKIDYVGLQTTDLTQIQEFKTFIGRRNNSIISNGTDPYYVKLVPSSSPVTNFVKNAPTSFVMKYNLINVESPVLQCSRCFKTLYGVYIWDQLYYSETTWQNTFEGPSPEIFIADLINVDIVVPLSSYLITNTAIYVNQVNYINRKSINVNPPYFQWYLPQCIVVTKSGMVATVCTRKKANYICIYDWLKYAIPTGYQCPSCGPLTRTSGAPLPGVSCFEDNPLANATLYPWEHEVKNAYISGTLDLFSSDFIPDPDLFVDFGNTTATFPGFFRSWLKWSNQYSSRPGQTSKNIAPELNWCDMCLECNWPVDCGIQIDPETNLEERYCAFSEEYCNLDIDIPENSLLPNSSIPPILLKVPHELSFTDPTCGYDIIIAQYLAADKFGGPQSDLYIYNQILALTQDYIQIQISTTTPKWYNSGKIASENFVFEWNDTVSISGYYYLDPCILCVDPIMEIIIYPLNLAYSFPTVYLSVNVSMEIGILTFYQVNFTVTQDDTGITTINGQEFPTLTFRNPGYLFHNIEIGSGLILYNPILTNSASRQQCETRILPPLYEPRLRIKATPPNNKCLITEEDLLLNPGYSQGECVCDVSLAGRTCDCPAVTSKYGKEVCGGFGDNLKSVLAPDGIITTTGDSTEQGCYIYGGGINVDCKTIDVARAYFTLLVDNAIFDYPSVFVPVSPARGVSLFQILPNNANTYFSFEEVVDACALKGMFLPFYYTIDELNQLAAVTRDYLPIFMGVDTTEATNDSWPWIDDAISGSYFIRDNPGTLSSEFGTCVGIVCDIVNFNNFAYGGSIVSDGSANYLIDGNTLIASAVPTNTILTWDIDSSLEVNIYTFGRTNTASAISCTFGTTCDDTIISSDLILYNCRCPNRQLSITSGIVISEIQIFSSLDTIRSTSYLYT